MKKRKKYMQLGRRWSNKLLCVLVDVAILVMVGMLASHISSGGKKLHYNIDRGVYPVKGIDVSAHNGVIDFDKVKSDTVKFVIIKSSEGADFCDARFSQNYKAATKAGLKVGAYHYFRFNTDGKRQARHFLNTISGRRFDLPLAVDVERHGNNATYDVAKVKTNLREFVDEIKRSGYPLMIYTNKSDYDKFIDGKFDDAQLWICSLSSRKPKHKNWVLWQHSHAGNVKGIPEKVDINTFNGNEKAFKRKTSQFKVKAQ